MTGMTISHYKVIEELGECGLGTLYRAEDERGGLRVTLRTLPAKFITLKVDKERFLDDVEKASSVGSDFVASVYGLEETADHTLLVLEYLEGERLVEKRGRLDIDEIIGIGTKLARCLRDVHGRGVVHGDIKSDNIILSPDGSVKLMDFGVAKLAGAARLTDPSEKLGTLAYASPEQIQGLEVDERTDLWSLGVVLYELLAGDLPFKGEYDAALHYEILNVEPPALGNFRRDIPESLQLLVSDLLEKNASRRTASAEDALRRLESRTAAPAAAKDVFLCVLYFDNLSLDEDGDHICAGITEDLIARLSRLHGIKVVPRQDVLPFRRRRVKTKQLGDTLGVNYVLEGSVRKSGSRLRVAARLTEASSGFDVWGNRYECLTEDVLDMQSDMVQTLAAAMRFPMTDAEEQRLARKPTNDVRAYDFYMRAREFLSRRGKRHALGAIQMLNNALAIDRTFALAYVGLADAYSLMYTYYDGDVSWLDRISEANKKALSLDKELVEARFSEGLVHYHHKRYDRAREILLSIVEKRPFYYDAYWWLGILSDVTGDYDAALEYYEKCAAIKPYSVEPWLYSNMTHRRKQDATSARESAKRFLEVGLDRLEVNPDDTVTLSRFAVIYTLFGEHDKARASLERILESETDDGLVLYNCASTYALLGDNLQALQCLRLALDNGFKNILEWLKTDPDFESLRETRGYDELLAKYDS